MSIPYEESHHTRILYPISFDRDKEYSILLNYEYRGRLVNSLLGVMITYLSFVGQWH
jgi:hypothetical protein